MKQLCNVVLLPTNEASKLVLSFKEKSFNHLTEPKLTLLNEETSYQLSNIQSQHLYITSPSEKIKEGDWFLSDDRNHISEAPKYRVEQCIKIENGWIYGSIDKMSQGHNPDWSKKIIATTDKALIVEDNVRTEGWALGKLYLPQIPESFVKKFVEVNGSITEVLVEYEAVFPKFGIDVEYKPKLRPDNTIIISPSKTYTREEVITLCKKHLDDALVYMTSSSPYIEGGFHKKWIEENL